MMMFDSVYWLFAVPGLLIGIWAQIKLSSAYGKYSRVGLTSGLNGAAAARVILDRAGLVNVPVNEVGGHLTDHYDPSKKALFLSSENFHGHSVAAVGVAAHEAGHALQHHVGYGMFKARMALVPVTQFANYAYIGIFVIGILFKMLPVVLPIIILAFGLMTLFQLVTLPVEFDASRRAKEQLFRLGLVHDFERTGVRKVLDAAALTYVAALVSAILNLLYFVTLARNNRN